MNLIISFFQKLKIEIGCLMIRKNFKRISDNLDLFVKDCQNRLIYVYRHSFILYRKRKGVDTNISLYIKILQFR